MFATLFHLSTAQSAFWRVSSHSSEIYQRQGSQPSKSIAHLQVINHFWQSALHCWLIVSSLKILLSWQPNSTPTSSDTHFGPFSPDRCWLRLQRKEEHYLLRKVILIKKNHLRLKINIALSHWQDVQFYTLCRLSFYSCACTSEGGMRIHKRKQKCRLNNSQLRRWGQ